MVYRLTTRAGPVDALSVSRVTDRITSVTYYVRLRLTVRPKRPVPYSTLVQYAARYSVHSILCIDHSTVSVFRRCKRTTELHLQQRCEME